MTEATTTLGAETGGGAVDEVAEECPTGGTTETMTTRGVVETVRGAANELEGSMSDWSPPRAYRAAERACNVRRHRNPN